MKKVYTHIGVIVGADARTNPKYRRNVLLRKTKTMWITEGGSRFRLSGRGTGDWPMYDLINICEVTAK